MVIFGWFCVALGGSTTPATPDAPVSWKRVVLTHVPLSLEVPAESEISEHEWPIGGVLSGVFRHGDAQGSFLVRAGEGVGLEEWRSDRQSWTIAKGAPVEICGRTVPTHVASRPEEHITCVIDPVHGNHPATLQAETELVVAFEHAGLPMSVRWAVPTQVAAEWSDAQKRFLSGIRCEAAGP